MLEDLRVPTAAIFDGLGTMGERVERLARELAAFYERPSEPWWRAYEREPDLISVVKRWRRQYYADIERLMRAALGELSADERSVAVVASVIGPPTFLPCGPAALRRTRRSSSAWNSSCPGSSIDGTRLADIRRLVVGKLRLGQL